MFTKSSLNSQGQLIISVLDYRKRGDTKRGVKGVGRIGFHHLARTPCSCYQLQMAVGLSNLPNHRLAEDTLSTAALASFSLDSNLTKSKEGYK